MDRNTWIEQHKQMSKDELLVLTYRLSTQHEKWRAARQMKESAKSMLRAYRDALVDKIETYTRYELLANIKSGEAFDFWVSEYLPSDELIRNNIYGEEE